MQSLIIYLLLFFSFAINAKTSFKTTAYSICSRPFPENPNEMQTIIIAMENLSEKSCQSYGLKKAQQYSSAGWKCFGRNNEEYYSCESKNASFFIVYNGIKLDHLNFTNLQMHKGIVAYVNKKSLKVCHEDQEELKSAGVKDAVCHKRP